MDKKLTSNLTDYMEVGRFKALSKLHRFQNDNNCTFEELIMTDWVQ